MGYNHTAIGQEGYRTGDNEDRRDHRVITIIEPQRLIILGSTALFTMAGQLHIHDDGKDGWDNFLFV